MCVRQRTLNRHFYDNFYYLITLKQIASLYYLFCHFLRLSATGIYVLNVCMLVFRVVVSICYDGLPLILCASFHIIWNCSSSDFMYALTWKSMCLVFLRRYSCVNRRSNYEICVWLNFFFFSPSVTFILYLCHFFRCVFLYRQCALVVCCSCSLATKRNLMFTTVKVACEIYDQ